MKVNRRSFLKHLGALGALALMSPTGAIQAIVPKEDWGVLAARSMKETIDADIIAGVRGQAIAEEFLKYCHNRPRGDVGRSVCAVETVISENTFGRLMRGMSIGKDRRRAKYFNCMLNDNLMLTGQQFEWFCKDALTQIKLAWTHDSRRKWSKPWGTAPRTLTLQEAERLMRSRAGRS